MQPGILGFDDTVRKMRKLDYSPGVDALLIEFSEKKIDHAEDMGQLIAHFTDDGELVLLEVLDAKNFLLEAFSTVLRKRDATRGAPT